MNDQSQTFRTSLLEENDGPGHNPTDNADHGRADLQRASRAAASSGLARRVGHCGHRQPDGADARPTTRAPAASSAFTFEEVEAGIDETHHVAAGYDADVLLRWGDPTLCRRAGVRSAEPDAGSPGQAVRLQQRLCRLYSARRLVRRTACSSSITNTPMRI